MSNLNTSTVEKHIADTRITRALGWIGCLFICIGAIAVTLEIDPLNIYMLNAGAIVYAVWGYRTKQWNQVTVNLFLIAVYSFGAIWRLI
jgi:4-hydroxybenzoate polyprenyltransferase